MAPTMRSPRRAAADSIRLDRSARTAKPAAARRGHAAASRPSARSRRARGTPARRNRDRSSPSSSVHAAASGRQPVDQPTMPPPSRAAVRGRRRRAHRARPTAPDAMPPPDMDGADRQRPVRRLRADSDDYPPAPTATATVAQRQPPPGVAGALPRGRRRRGQPPAAPRPRPRTSARLGSREPGSTTSEPVAGPGNLCAGRADLAGQREDQRLVGGRDGLHGVDDPSSASRSSTPRTRISGTDAPEVTPTVVTPSSQAGSTSSA